MRLQVTYAQFLTILALMGAQALVFYVVTDGLVTHVMIRDPKFGGTGLELVGDVFPTVESFLLEAPSALVVSAIS